MLPTPDHSSSTALSGATGPVQVDVPISLCHPANPVEHTHEPNLSLGPTSDVQLGLALPEGHSDVPNPQKIGSGVSTAVCNGASQQHAQQDPQQRDSQQQVSQQQQSQQSESQQQKSQQQKQQQQQSKSRKGKRKGRPAAQAEGEPGPAEANGAAVDGDSIDAKQARPDVEHIMAEMQR